MAGRSRRSSVAVVTWSGGADDGDGGGDGFGVGRCDEDADGGHPSVGFVANGTGHCGRRSQQGVQLVSSGSQFACFSMIRRAMSCPTNGRFHL
eukprot:scaffold119790_cov54-Attheya_sp.AAC.2